MADDEVVVPSEGNAGLDPARAALKPILDYLGGQEGDSAPSGLTTKSTKEFVSGSQSESTTPTASSEGYSMFAKTAEGAEKMNTEVVKYEPDSEKGKRQKVVILEGDGGGGGRARNPIGGAGRSTDASYGYMQFKSPLFRQHVGSSQYKLLIPLGGSYLPQIAGPFRPLTMETQGGVPQCLGAEAAGTGMPINMDLE